MKINEMDYKIKSGKKRNNNNNNKSRKSMYIYKIINKDIYIYNLNFIKIYLFINLNKIIN